MRSEMTCHTRGEVRETRWCARPDGLEEAVVFIPGYNCTDRSMRGHGVHGMEIRWYLRGPAGATQFVMYTDWIPGTRSPGHGLQPDGSYSWANSRGLPMWPFGIDVGYHARAPRYADQSPREGCEVLDGATCYYDGSGIRGYELAPKFIDEGEQVIWRELEAWYRRLLTEPEDRMELPDE